MPKTERSETDSGDAGRLASPMQTNKTLPTGGQPRARNTERRKDTPVSEDEFRPITKSNDHRHKGAMTLNIAKNNSFLSIKAQEFISGDMIAFAINDAGVIRISPSNESDPAAYQKLKCRSYAYISTFCRKNGYPCQHVILEKRGVALYGQLRKDEAS